MAEERRYTLKELQEMQSIFKNNPASTTITSQPVYGPYQDGSGRYGTFSYPGIRPEMFSAFQRPFTLASLLGVRESMIANEKIGVMTGATAAGGTNAADFCGDPPTPGQLKRCVQNYIWGKWFMKTNLNNVAEAGEYVDYADVNKKILNLVESPNPFIPDIMTRLDISNRSGLLLANELWNIGTAFERSFDRVAIRGNATLAPANTQLGWIKEFNGLERQYTTGKVDLDTGLPCPAVDSTVISWGTGIDATVAGRTFVEMLTDTFFEKTMEAERMGFTGIQWAWEMSMRLFRALTYIWACQYYTYRCSTNATNPNYTMAETIRNDQLDMWNGRYLLIDGMRVPVIFSDGINTVRASATVYTDDNMFLTPVGWSGGKLLNLEYKKMDNEDAMQFANFGGVNRVFPMNNGMFLATTRFTGFCVEHLFAAKMRIVQDAPWLGAVINTIQYTYAAPYRNPLPGASDHFNGGATVWDGNYTVS
jgi:hypothetical protein